MSGEFRLIDLSRTLRPGGPETSALPRFATWWYARREWGDAVNFQAMLISEHTGTNVDAPLHVLDEGETSLGRLFRTSRHLRHHTPRTSG
jgi:kynurenine formamidase